MSYVACRTNQTDKANRVHTKSAVPSFDNIWEDFFGTGFSTSETPRANVYETDKDVKVKLSLPGYDKSNISVNVKDNVLTVEAQSNKDGKIPEENLKSKEFSSVHTKRSFRLGNEINTDSVKAEYVNGILTLTLQKKEEATPKKIEIS